MKWDCIATCIELFAKYVRVPMRINKKEICKIFQQYGLKMTIETNLQASDSFNSTFNIRNGKCNHFITKKITRSYIFGKRLKHVYMLKMIKSNIFRPQS